MTAYAMPTIGDVIADKYRLDKVAGEGGMGIVYVAEHLVLKQRVAVKVLLPGAATSESVVERFRSEARAAAKIDSEHVARVLDAGSLSSGAPFLVMEFLEGCDLEELLQLQRTLPIAETVDYLIQALEGLAHAHAAGIIHRDLKPANLFLACRPDGTNAIKLLDFGISKTTKATPQDKKLTGHHVLGSPTYMSPEQLRNAPSLDARADLWSLGVVGYELLSGTPPFDGDGVGEIFAAILESTPVPLSERSPHVPAELASILAKCMRREPDERWTDAAAVARALAPFGSDASGVTVDRAEQVLLRARMMAVPKTPLETRRVVEAIDAAAKRAMVTGYEEPTPVLPLARLKQANVVPTVAEVVSGKFHAFSRRSPLKVGVIGAVLTFALGLGVVAAARGIPKKPVVLTEMKPLVSSPPPQPEAAPLAVAVAEPVLARATVPVAAEPAPSASVTAPAVQPGPKTGRRPKFLTTRE